jgi:SAM-dependent methyltransferase
VQASSVAARPVLRARYDPAAQQPGLSVVRAGHYAGADLWLIALPLDGTVVGGDAIGWAESGRAWGERAADWAYLLEPYARRANDALFDRVGVGSGTRLVDIACGSGYAAGIAADRGAEVSGLDASESLIAIAQARTPAGDFRVGDMFALPFADAAFDVATSFNGIWKGCEDALREARRVVRPGGLVGFSFWGSPRRLGLLPYFAALLELSPADHADATLNQGDTGRPGVAEQMLGDCGLKFVDRGSAQVICEFPDLDVAVRALAAAGPSWPALQHAGYERFAETMRAALHPLYTEGLGVRIISEFGWIMGEVPLG